MTIRPRRALAALLLAALPLTVSTLPTTPGNAAPAAPEAAAAATSAVRIMTFNIAFLSTTNALAEIPDLIEYYDPQVVILNEVDQKTGPFGNQPAYLAARLNMQVQYYGTERKSNGARGNAVLIPNAAPYRFLKVSTSPLKPDGCYQRGVIGAKIAIGATNINVAATHLDTCPAGVEPATEGNIAYRQALELNRMIGDPGCPTFLGGDMNREPGTGTHDVLRTHLRDAWIQAGQGNQFTKDFEPNKAPRRIDYLFFDNAQAVVADVPNNGEPVNDPDGNGYDSRYADSSFPSDHKPVVATFRISAATPSC